MTTSYVDSLRRFLERQEVEGERRRAKIAACLKEATKRLTTRFPTVTRVAVVGSFLTPYLFRADSDVDIVVRGLSRTNYFDALFLLERELRIPVDLIREEEIPEGLHPRFKNALVLYVA